MLTYSKSQIKSMITFLKKAGLKARPVLGNACIQDGKMAITNTFVALWLNEDLPDLPHVEDGKGFPNTRPLINGFKQDVQDKKPVKIDLAKIKEEISKKSVSVVVSGCLFDPKLIKFACDIMNDDRLVVVKLKSGYGGMAHIDNSRGFGSVIGMRTYDDKAFVGVTDVTLEEVQ